MQKPVGTGVLDGPKSEKFEVACKLARVAIPHLTVLFGANIPGPSGTPVPTMLDRAGAFLRSRFMYQTHRQTPIWRSNFDASGCLHLLRKASP